MLNPLVAVAIFSFFLFSPAVFSQEKYKLCYAESWLTTDVDGVIVGGPLTKSIKKIFDLVDPNIKLEMTLLPWKRCQRLVESGQFDGLMRLQKTEERKNKFIFSTRVSTSYLYFIYLTESDLGQKNWQVPEDFENKILGFVRGNPIGEAFEQAKKNKAINWQATHSDEMNLKMLIANRVDFISWEGTRNQPLLFSEEHLKIIGDTDISAMKKPHMVNDLYMAFSRKSPILSILPQINEAIDTLREEGKMEMEYWSNKKAQ